MTNPYFFGYGSLVNVATHDYHNPQPARLSGWRRAWVHTDLSEAAFLTAVPCGDSEIDGLIAAVPGADWQALDLREHAYDRLPADGAVSHGVQPTPAISVYAVPRSAHNPGSARHPILLSYLPISEAIKSIDVEILYKHIFVDNFKTRISAVEKIEVLVPGGVPLKFIKSKTKM